MKLNRNALRKAILKEIKLLKEEYDPIEGPTAGAFLNRSRGPNSEYDFPQVGENLTKLGNMANELGKSSSEKFHPFYKALARYLFQLGMGIAEHGHGTGDMGYVHGEGEYHQLVNAIKDLSKK